MKPEEYFKDFPGSEKCYQTSDGIIFHHRGDAHLHAKSLKDDEVTEHKAVKLNAEAKEDGTDTAKVKKQTPVQSQKGDEAKVKKAVNKPDAKSAAAAKESATDEKK